MADNPFRGTLAFEEADKDRFFGREREAYDLESLAVARRSVLLYAPSGAGKTSLLKARLKPGLTELHGPGAVEIARLGLPPRAADANPLVASVLSSLLADDGAGRTLADGLAERLAPTQTPFFLILDQFEELFTATSDRPAWRNAFLDQLADALDRHPRVSVVLALREDYLPQLDALRHLLPDGLRTRLRLGFLEEAAARAAICGPLAGLEPPIELPAAVVDQLVAELARAIVISPDGRRAEVRGPIEPVYLQVVCWWLARDLLGRTRDPEAATVTGAIDAYFAERPVAESVKEALAAYYRAGVSAAAAAAQVPEYLIRRFLATRLITAQRTRNLVPRGETETAGLANAAVEALVEHYLVRREDRRGLFWYELAHDRLIEPVLAERSDLEAQIWLWEEQGRPRGLLWSFSKLWRCRPRLRYRPSRFSAAGEAGKRTLAQWLAAFLWPDRAAEEREFLGSSARWLVQRACIALVIVFLVALGPLIAFRVWVSFFTYPFFEIEQQVFYSDAPPDRTKTLLLLLVHHDFSTARAYRWIHPHPAELRDRSRRLLLDRLAQGPPPHLGPDATDAELRARACALAGRNLSEEELYHRDRQNHGYMKNRDYLAFAYNPCPQFPDQIQHRSLWVAVCRWPYDELDRYFPRQP